MKDLSKTQLKRREDVLNAVLELVESHGYEKVTMRDIAKRANVALKTLYDIHGSKANLLARAIEERTRDIYDQLGTGIEEKGLERLFRFLERQSEGTLAAPNLAKALAPILISDPGAFHIDDIYRRHHRGAILEIRKAGDLEDWVDVDFLVRLLLVEGNSVLMLWANGEVPSGLLSEFARLKVCQVLRPATRGKTLERIRDEQKGIYRRLAAELSD